MEGCCEKGEMEVDACDRITVVKLEAELQATVITWARPRLENLGEVGTDLRSD